MTFTGSPTTSFKSLDLQSEQARANDDSASEDARQKCSRTRRYAYSAVSWRNEDSMSNSFQAANMKASQTKRYVLLHQRKATATPRLNTTRPSENTQSELSAIGTQGPVVNSNGPVCVLTEKLYMVPATIGVDTTVMHQQDVAADTCSGYSPIARRSLFLGWEDCLLKDSKVPNLPGASKTPLYLAEVVSYALQHGNTVHRASFIVAKQLALDVLSGTRFLNEHLRIIDVKN